MIRKQKQFYNYINIIDLFLCLFCIIKMNELVNKQCNFEIKYVFIFSSLFE